MNKEEMNREEMKHICKEGLGRGFVFRRVFRLSDFLHFRVIRLETLFEFFTLEND